MIGAALAGHAERAGMQVVCASRRARPGMMFIDLAQPPSSWEIPVAVDVAFLCAGMTSVPDCRSRPQTAWTINVENTWELARRLTASGVFVVFPSSNRVFDGSVPRQRVDAPVCPMTVYGRTKAAIEEKLFSLGEKVAIVRFTKILDSEPALIAGWKVAMDQGRLVRPFVDMSFAPVSQARAVSSLLEVGLARVGGVMQGSATSDISYADACRWLAKAIKCPTVDIEPISGRDTGDDYEHVPQYTTLDTSSLELACGFDPPTPYESLQEVIRV